MLRIFCAALFAVAGSVVQAATISVFATGTMPSSPLTSGTETWVFSGSFSDTLPDENGAFAGGQFEFTPSDLATLDFSIDGVSIDFLAPTSNLDSRITLFGSNLSFSLFFDPADPFFGGGYTNASFTISLTGGPYATDDEDLSTLGSIDAGSGSTYLFYKPVGGGYSSAGGSGSVSITAPSVVPLPASFFLLGSVLAGLFGLRKFRRRFGRRIPI